MSSDAQFRVSPLQPVFSTLARAGGWVRRDSALLFGWKGMVRKRVIGDGQLRDLEQTYIQAIYRYQEALEQGPSLACKARREMYRLEVEVRRLRYGY